jgi:hypothetical protein
MPQQQQGTFKHACHSCGKQLDNRKTGQVRSMPQNHWFRFDDEGEQLVSQYNDGKYHGLQLLP